MISVVIIIRCIINVKTQQPDVSESGSRYSMQTRILTAASTGPHSPKPRPAAP